MYRNDSVSIDPSLIDALNESTVPSPEDTLISAEAYAEAEDIDRNDAFNHFITIN